MADASHFDRDAMRAERLAEKFIRRALHEHELRQRLALSIRTMRRILRALDGVSFERAAPGGATPHAALGAIANLVDQAAPIAAGLKNFHRIRWQLNRQSHRSRRRELLEQRFAGAGQQE